MIMAGLGLYSLSLVFKGNQWFFALPGGIPLFLGCLAFLSWVKNLVKRQNISDSDMEKAIQRVYRQNGLTKKRRRKHKTKNDLRAIKAAWPLFSQIDADTKDLFDIPEYWIQMRRYNLPRVQYTAREVVSGLKFIAYAQERSLSFANLFAQRIIGHLQQNGVDLSQTIWQTDNGSEFIGSWQARDKSAFTRTIESIPGQRHKQIPPGAHTYQSDLETVHSLIESEFYEIESFSSREDFLNKAASYQLFFNVVRKNGSKGDRTPLEIIKEREPAIDPKIVLLPPVFLDELLIYQLDNGGQGGYHVPSYPSAPWSLPKNFKVYRDRKRMIIEGYYPFGLP